MEDSRIVELFWRRSENAIRETELAYGRYGKVIAKNILGNDEDAAECLNDAYLRLWNAIPPERPQKLGLYLGRIVRNLSLDRQKAETAQKRGGGQYTVVWEELADALAAKEGVEERWQAARVTELLNRFLSGLPKEKRAVFVMRYWYFDSVEKIAETTAFSKSKVKMLLLRTRKELRDYLVKEGIDL